MAVIRTIDAQRSIDIGGIPNTQVNDAVGRGMQQVGGALADLGKHRQEQAEKFSQFQSKEALIRLDDELAADLDQMKLNVDPTGRGLTEQFSPVVNNKMSKFLNSLPPDQRAQNTEWLMTMRGKYLQQAANAETQQNYKYQANSIDDQTARNDLAVLANPDAYDAAAADNKDTINKSTLPPAVKYEIERKKDRELKLARHKGVIAADPQRFLDETGRTVRLPAAKVRADVATRGQQAMAFFASRGYSKEQAAGIVGNLIQESSMQASGAVGDNGTAFGLAQWRGERFTRLKRYAASARKDWQDFGTQLAFIDMELQNHETDAYQRLKSARTVDEATAAFIGYERPKGWTQGTPRAGHGYGNRLANAAAMAGLPDVEYKEGNSPFSGITDNPMYDGLSVDDIMALQGQARTRINQESTAQKSYLNNTMDNAKAAYLSTGSYDGPEVSYQAVLNAYGAAEGEQKWAEFQTAKSMGHFINEMKTMSDGDINTRLQSVKPLDTSSPNYATELQGYEAAAKAAASLKQARTSDPASYVQSAFPSVAGAVDAYRQAGPDQRQRAASEMYRSMDEAFDTLGIVGRDRAYLPKTTIDGITNAVKDETLDLNNRMNAIMSPLLATSSPEQQRAIFEQMVRADNGIAKMEAAVEAYSRGDMGAARRLFQASMMDKGSLPVKSTYTDDAIKQQISDDIMSSSEIGDVTYGFSLNMVGTAERARRDGDLLFKAVRLEMARNGDDLTAAINQAKRDVYGPVQIVDDSNIRATIPDSADPKAFSNGIMAKMPSVRAALVAQLPDAKALESLPADQRGNYEVSRRMLNIKIDDIIDNGYWHNLGNGYGFIDPASGLPVADKSGKPLIFPMEQIIGTPAPDGVTVTQPQVNTPQGTPPMNASSGYFPEPPRGAGGAMTLPGVSEQPTVQGQLKEQRAELFQNAQNSGMLDGGTF